MSTLWADNLLAYSIQFAVLVISALAAARVFGIKAPRVAQQLWRTVALVAIALPLLQPWTKVSTGLVRSTLIFATQAVAPNTPPPDPVEFPAAVLVIIAAGALLRLAWLVLGLFRLRTLERNSIRLRPLPDFAVQLQRELGTEASIRISDYLEGPATIGVRNPVVLIPRRVLDLSPEIQRAIVCHELLHVRRRDWLHTLAEEVACALLWFHPAARLLTSRLNLARESVVDQQTIAHTDDRRNYAEALLAFAGAKPTRIAAVTPLIRRRHLAQRIALVMQEVSMSRTRVALVVGSAAVVVALTTVAAVDRFPISTKPAPQAADTPYKPGNGVTLPRVVKEVKPVYTAAALQAKIQGSVWMEIVVLATGDVGNIEITRSLDREYGLDDEAVKAARQWTFEPGRKDGKPVPVQVMLELTFTLKK